MLYWEIGASIIWVKVFMHPAAANSAYPS